MGRHDKRISQYPPGPVTSLSETSLRLGPAVSSSNCCHRASHIFPQPFLLQDLVIALPRGQGREPKRYPNPPSCSSASSISATGAYRRQQNWSPAQHRIPVPGGDPHPIEPHYAMTTPTSIARTAPIAIAARRPRTDTSLELPNNNTNGRGHLSASMSSTTSAESGTNTRSRKDRPCDACRRRKSRCVINEGQTSCVLCQFHTQECTFVQSPQPRKRKLNTEGKEESVAKRRCAKTKTFLLQRPLFPPVI